LCAAEFWRRSDVARHGCRLSCVDEAATAGLFGPDTCCPAHGAPAARPRRLTWPRTEAVGGAFRRRTPSRSPRARARPATRTAAARRTIGRTRRICDANLGGDAARCQTERAHDGADGLARS